MYRFKKAALALCFLGGAVAILIFMLENQQLISISFLGVATPQLPISVFIVFFLLVGMVLGPLLGVVFKRKRSSVRLG